MKTTFKLLFLLAATSVLMTQCKKNDTTYNTYFYTTTPDSDTQLSLYIDDKYWGEIPYLQNKPTCDNDSLKQMALFFTLKSGKYRLVAKDKQGVVKSSGTMKISKNKLSSSGGTGGQEISNQGGCLIIGFY